MCVCGGMCGVCVVGVGVLGASYNPLPLPLQNCVSTLLDCYVQDHASQGSLVDLGKAAFSLLGRLPRLQVSG